MSIFTDVVRTVANAIKRRVDQRRSVPRPGPLEEHEEISEQEIIEAMDAASKAARAPDWRKSIVDLQKSLGLPSDHAYLAALAKDMDIKDYTGTAEQNTLMHKLVMDDVRRGGLPIPAG